MRAKDIRAMPKEDLMNKLSELKRELIKNNAQIATGTTPKSPGQMREIKKTIARILTIAKEKPLKETKELPKPANESEKGLEKSTTSQKEDSKKPEAKVKPKEEKTEE